MTGGNWVLLVHAASTLSLAGVIWVVQLVHYPSFVFVSPANFDAFAAFHQRTISYVVVPLMLIELVTAAVMLVYRPAAIPFWMILAGAVLLVVVWASTFLIQVPLHTQLTHGFEHEAVRKLVQTNWLRTMAWTARGILAIATLAIAISAGNAGE
jgi:hypothetical protein